MQRTEKLTELKKIITVRNLLEFVLIFILYRSFEIAGIKKYAVAVVFCLVLLFLGRKKQWSADILCVAIPAVTYLVTGGVMGMVHGTYQSDTVKIILYGVLSLLLAFSMDVYYGKDMKRIADIQFFACCGVYLSLTIVYMVTRLSRVESTFAFVFGLFAIYYAYQKRWKLFVLSIVFVYLSDKRIVLLGVAVSLLIMGLLWLFEHNRKLVYGIWAVVSAMVGLYLYLIYSGTMEAFCWGANINTNGRVEMYGRMAKEFSVTFLGEGLGVVENLLAFWNVQAFANLHNDLLKFHIELGFLGLLFYLLSYGLMFYLAEKKFGKSKTCFLLCISIYSMLLYATDNVSIYVMYLLPMYSIFFTVLSSDEKARLEEKGKQ